MTYRRIMSPDLEGWLRSLGDVTFCKEPRSLTEDAYSALWEQTDAVLTGWGVRPPTVETLERARDLKIICHTAGSVRMIPRRALELGIIVTTARPAIARTVAEFCLLNAMFLLRRYRYYTSSDGSVQSFYSPKGAAPASETLYGQTVGLVGYGTIARIFRRLLAPFGCRVLIYDPHLTVDSVVGEDVEHVDLHRLLNESRIVSLHAPDIPETRGMIGARELSLLQEGAVFLNSARGRLVDTDALTEALRTGRFYAAIDVTEPEPLPEDHPLRSMPNVLFTPHIAGPTSDELPELPRTALADLERVLNGQPPLYAMTIESYDLMSY